MSIFSIKQPWLKSALVDGVFILSPPFLALLAVVCFPQAFKNSDAMPLVYWVMLVVMVDVAHVYSTLYRTYLRPDKLTSPLILTAVPLVCYIAGVLLYSAGGLVFWSVLAYLAVFHFVRQQYGFMRLYARQEKQPAITAYIDTLTIYTATLYPLLYWHLSADRKFSWFVDGDFFQFQNQFLLTLAGWLYAAVLVCYIVKEAAFCIVNRWVNVPRNLMVVGTVLSWYFGIVYYNGDMAFTTLNVISHGIPYMALIYIFERKGQALKTGKASFLFTAAFSRYTGILFFITFLIALAYLEEGLWDGLVWREHLSVFQPFKHFPQIEDEALLTLLIPLLALPQSTHYVLDGFIWKIRQEKVER